MRILLLSVFLTVFAVSMFAQAPKLACDGNTATVRVSAITPTGSVEGFLKAVAAHKEWYRSHGQPVHEIFAARIIVRDEATRAQMSSEKEVMTYHINPVTSTDRKSVV